MSDFEREGRFDEASGIPEEVSEIPAETPADAPVDAPADAPESAPEDAGGTEEQSAEETAAAEAAEAAAKATAERLAKKAAAREKRRELPRVLAGMFRNMPPSAKMALSLFVITSVSAALLAATHILTERPISEHRQAAVERALAEVLPGRAGYALIDGAELPGSARELYAAYSYDGGEDYAVNVAPNGYGGEIEMMVGVDAGGSVTGVSIVSMTETAGLGTKAGSPEFLGRFTGKRAGVSIGRGDNDIDAIAGATISSRAVTTGVSDALAAVAAYTASSYYYAEEGDGQ
ncbi:MAG: RnfABCDGE type electron transport complex subunit G [Oscillospiraceae bacterium]|nr:RnfABCDGE type electron transport complex subunit G [Oscillospiraceae bacterium]